MEEEKAERKLKQISYFLDNLPYKERTVFGYITLFDPRQRIKETVFTQQSGIPCMGLDAGEKVVLDYLVKGRYYATTGTRFNIIYFLSMRMKQSDWLIRLSQRAVFLHPARCEMHPARCEMQPARCEIQPKLGEKL